MANIQLSLQTDGKNTFPSSLTPPVTPTAKESGSIHFKDTNTDQSPSKEKTLILAFTDDLEICRDNNDRSLEYGRGVWSIVYKARSAPAKTALGTPPSSPVTTPQIFAVKAPLRRDARPVLKAEAQTLTRLTYTPGASRHIVPFHGFHAELGALVLSAIPLSLSTYIEEQSDVARKRQPATPTMFDPVQGPASYRDLACKLISGLNWLHDVAGVVHGDIKPQNILLRAIEDEHDFPFEPLFADFSATVDIPQDADAPLDTTRASMSSFTPPFTAPEMLASLTCSEMAPTPASDVFSLAASLLAAATGDLQLYSNMNHRLRLEMAKAGHQIIDFTRSGNNGNRVPRNGFVERIVKPAVVKDPAMRTSTADWVKLASA
jgi:serine/threonine protein kinase